MELSVTAARSGRLSSFLKEEMKLSTGLMNRLKWKNVLFVNGVPRHTDYPVAVGDVITVLLDDQPPQYPAEDGELTILYEDAHLLAVEKPAGMLIHPSRSRNTGTLANLVVGYYGRTGQNCAFHPVTRLDRDTFGVVLLGKNAHIHTLLQNTAMEKTYHALVYGEMPQAEGTIDAPIARKPLPSLLREIRDDGKPSVTLYRVLEKGEGWSKVALQPVTGRTHQLRLHCAYVGAPILGDPQYGSAESGQFSRALGLESQLLCAYRLAFNHPMTGKKVVISAESDAKIPEIK